MPKPPDACETMIDVREGVDATDQELVALLERRFGYMRAAARIKPNREAVRDEVSPLTNGRIPVNTLRTSERLGGRAK